MLLLLPNNLGGKKHMTRRELLALSASLGISPLVAQAPKVEKSDEEETVIKGGVELVNVAVTVRGKNNALVTGLKAQDFKILEDGKEQQLRNVSAESNLPLIMGLLIDISATMLQYVKDEQRSGARFLRQVMRPGDRAFVAAFRQGPELMQDVTGNVAELEAGLKAIAGSQSQCVGTALYDTVYLSCEQRLQGQNERKALILLSDGTEFGSAKSLDDAIKAAQLTETIIYAIAYNISPTAFSSGGRNCGQPQDRFAPVTQSAADAVMRQLANDTGGRVFRIAGSAALDQIYDEIEKEIRSQYILSYSPSNTKKDGKFRKIEVKASNRDYYVSARRGYYTAKQ